MKKNKVLFYEANLGIFYKRLYKWVVSKNKWKETVPSNQKEQPHKNLKRVDTLHGTYFLNLEELSKWDIRKEITQATLNLSYDALYLERIIGLLTNEVNTYLWNKKLDKALE